MRLLPLLLAAQPVPAQNAEPFPAPWPDPEREMPGDGAMTPERNGLEARQTLTRYAACVARQSPEKVASLLQQDFRTTAYQNGLRNLSRANEGCARQVGLRGSMRMNGLPFAGALAELMLRQGPEHLNKRLAKAIGRRKVETFGPSDQIAMCTVRSAPDDVAALFATDVGTTAEATASKKVEAVAKLCSKSVKLETTTDGLRAIVATASYRLLAGQESQS
jgi:hypothetical protein